MLDVLLAVLVVAAPPPAPAPPAPQRRCVEHVVTSTDLPKIAVRVDEALDFLGRVEGDAMGGRARTEQFFFAEARDGRVRRMVIVHFEGAVPGADLHFRYPRLRMETLGGEEYLHQSFPEEDWDLFASPKVAELFTSRKIELPRRWLVDRYVRAVDAELRHEVILFYLEPAGDLPAPVDDLRLAGKSRALWEPIDRDLALRARKAFEVVPH
jgi:hypothetical protein